MFRNVRFFRLNTAWPRTEQFLAHLRAAFGTFDVVPLAFKRPYADLLSRTFLGDAPRSFGLGRECRMCDSADAKASIRCAAMDLADPAVRRHVREGMWLTHLEIELENIMTCTLDAKGGIGKLRLTGSEVADELAEGDALARLDAEFALLSGALRQLVQAMKQALAGYEDEALPIERIAVGA